MPFDLFSGWNTNRMAARIYTFPFSGKWKHADTNVATMNTSIGCGINAEWHSSEPHAMFWVHIHTENERASEKECACCCYMFRCLLPERIKKGAVFCCETCVFRLALYVISNNYAFTLRAVVSLSITWIVIWADCNCFGHGKCYGSCGYLWNAHHVA